MKGLFTIGEFAELSRISPKALRLYAERGLLAPTRVDDESGYRYYRAEQLPAARLIALLRAADMPLREIRRFLVDPGPELLAEYEERLHTEQEARLDVLRYVRRVLEEAEMFEVQTKHVPAQRYVSKTANVTVDALAPFIDASIGELAAGGIEGAPFTIFHGLVNETDDGPVEVGVPRGSGDRELPGADVAFVLVSGESAKFPEILGAYDALTRWARERGRDFAAPPREVYLSRPGEPAQWEVAWPLGQ